MPDDGAARYGINLPLLVGLKYDSACPPCGDLGLPGLTALKRSRCNRVVRLTVAVFDVWPAATSRRRTRWVRLEDVLKRTTVTSWTVGQSTRAARAGGAEARGSRRSANFCLFMPWTSATWWGVGAARGVRLCCRRNHDLRSRSVLRKSTHCDPVMRG